MSSEGISSSIGMTGNPSNEQVDPTEPSLASVNPTVGTSHDAERTTEEQAIRTMRSLIQNITPNITGLDIGPKPPIEDQIRDSRQLRHCHAALTSKWLSDEELESADMRLQQYEEDSRGWDSSFPNAEDAALRRLWDKAAEYYQWTRRQ